MDQEDFVQMVQSLEELIEEEDSLRIYQLCELCARKGSYWGKGEMFEEKEVFIV